MKLHLKLASFLLSISVLLITSCKDDPVPKTTVDFDQDQYDGGEMSISESNGGVSSFHPLLYQDGNGNAGTGVDYDIKLKLSRAVAQTTVIRFSTSGTATQSTALEIGDYQLGIEGDLVVIEKGQNTVKFPVTIFEDYDFEIDSQDELSETFTIKLEEVVVGPGVIGENNTFDVHILEDDAIILLDWSATGENPLPTNPNRGDVDMDLIIWMNNEQLTASANAGTDPEGINIPGGFPNATYGLSYTYYSGTSNSVRFYVDIINLGGNLNGSSDPRSYNKTYTLSNINQYDVSGNDPFVAQSMTKSSLNYSGLVDITVNSTGSRMETGSIIYPKGEAGRLPIRSLSKSAIDKLKRIN